MKQRLCTSLRLVLALVGPAIAQNLVAASNHSIAGAGVHVHRSRGNPDAGEPDIQAMIREMAAAVGGKIQHPVMTPTRSSFLAKWQAVDGATGYRLDISTTPSFSTYVSNYRDLDIGNVTSHLVSGLKPGTEYCYRVRPYNETSTGGNSEVTRATTADTSSGLVIIPTFDSTITSDPRSAAIQAMVISAIEKYQTLFRDPITVSIRFRLSTVHPDGTPLENNLVGASDTGTWFRDWNEYITALIADGKTANDAAANASLPSTPLTSTIGLRSALGRAVGLDTSPVLFADGSLGLGGSYDGIITLNSSKPLQFTRPASPGNFDALMFTEHEIDEVLGLGSHLDSARPESLEPEDLFSWSSLNARNTSSSGQRFFSIDQGFHLMVQLNQTPGGDFGDYDSDGFCPANRLYVQNAFNCAGVATDISETSPEAVNLDVIGYDLVPPLPPPPTSGVLGNISTRLAVGSGDYILIGGFQVAGNTSKQLVLRALGPTLAQFGLANPMQDPTLELHDSTGAIVAFNDDWQDAPNAQSIPPNLQPSNGLESAMLVTLNPGAYTAILRGFGNSTGLALVEVYDMGGSGQLTNISTRGFVQTGDNVMIAGVVVQSQNKQVVVRAIGPTLTGLGVPNALPDPTLDLHDSNGARIAFNDDWKDSQQALIESTGLAPSNDLESAIAGTLAPGNYTAIVRGFNDTIGNALIEVFAVN